MARWIKMPLGRKVGLDPSDIVLDGDPAPSFAKNGAQPTQFLTHVYCAQMIAHLSYCWALVLVTLRLTAENHHYPVTCWEAGVISSSLQFVPSLPVYGWSWEFCVPGTFIFKLNHWVCAISFFPVASFPVILPSNIFRRLLCQRMCPSHLFLARHGIHHNTSSIYSLYYICICHLMLPAPSPYFKGLEPLSITLEGAWNVRTSVCLFVRPQKVFRFQWNLVYR